MPAIGRYPAEVFNINNAARNLVEIIANEARSDDAGDYRIRIYTLGMGELVTYLLGTRQEPSEDILKRISNDTDISGLQPRSARRQVLLRPDARRRGTGVSGHPEPDHSLDQVDPHPGAHGDLA